jgi:hypothetical protein
VLASDSPRLRSRRLGWLVAICAIVALLVAMAAPSRADAVRVRCAGTFRVLHNDRVGGLSLPRSDVSGSLSPPSTLEPQTASFRRSAGGRGFRIRPAA